MPQIFHVKAERIPDPSRHVFIALLSGRPMTAAMLEFFWQTQAELWGRGFAADLFILEGHCHVDDARNQCAWEFRKTECSHFLFVDDDNCTSKEAVADLLACNRDVVAGSYPFKGDEVDFPIRFLRGKPFEVEADGCAEVEMVPTGFLMLKREVVEAACKISSFYYNKEAPKEGPHGPIYELFHRETDSLNERWGGDYNFCRKLLKLGYKVYVKPDYWFRHYGEKAFTGNLAVWRAQKDGKSTPQFTEAVEAIRAGEVIPIHFFQMHLHWGNKYALPPDSLQAAFMIAQEATGPTLETGSGLTTLVMALAAERSGQMHYALEHDPDYYRETIALLKRHKVKNVRLLYAPLQPTQYGGGKSCLWYSNLGELPDEVEFVLLDGPQRRFGRDGLFKVMGEMVRGAKILCDDFDDPVEQRMLKRWAATLGRELHEVQGEVRPFGLLMPEARAPKVSQVA